MADLVLKNANGDKQTYEGVTKIIVKDTSNKDVEFEQVGEDIHSIKIIDYDGTIIDEQNLQEGDVYTLPAAPPSHDRLVFQKWSSPINIVDGIITMPNRDIIIGPSYTTSSGLTEIDVEVTPHTGLSVALNIGGTKNWGDGTSDTSNTHTYASYGEYTITFAGTFSGSNGVFNQASSYILYCINVRLANQTSLPAYAFRGCTRLKTISFNEGILTTSINSLQSCASLRAVVFPTTITSIDGDTVSDDTSLKYLVIPNGPTYVPCITYNYSMEYLAFPDSTTRTLSGQFRNCYQLNKIELPSGVTTIASSIGSNCYSLKKIQIPDSVTTLSSSCFSYLQGLESIKLPAGITEMPTSAVSSCSSLKNVEIPDSVTTIASSAMSSLESIQEIVLPANLTSIGASAFTSNQLLEIIDATKCKAVPTLANVNAFPTVRPHYKIIVPDALYDEWIESTNWTSLADYIYKESEV